MLELQFSQDQFNQVANFTVFLQAVIEDQEAVLLGRVGGAVFNSTIPVIASQVKAAAISMVAAELLQRRINRLSGSVDADAVALMNSLRAARKEYATDAESKITRVVLSGASPDSGGFSSGVWTSSHYEDNP